MSSARATTTAHSEGAASAQKAYVTTGPFYTAIFTYSTYLDSSFVKRGLLTVNQLANAGTTGQNTTFCPAGRVLALNSRKLTPGVNPMDYIITTYNGTQVATTPKFYIGVSDLVSGINGFIDPTNPLFAVYDKNRPVTDYLTDMSAVSLGLTAGQASLGSGQGAKINTVAYSFTQGTSTITTVPVGVATAGKITMFGAVTTEVSFTVTAANVTTNSVVILTASSGGTPTAAPIVTLSSTANGSFVVDVLSAVSCTPLINFLIIN